MLCPVHHLLWQSVNVVRAILQKDPTPLNEFPKDIGLQQQYATAAWLDWDVEDTLNNFKTVLKLPFQYKLVNLSHNQIKLLNHKLYLIKLGT